MSSICGDNEDILFGADFRLADIITNAIVFQKNINKMFKEEKSLKSSQKFTPN